VHQRFQRCPLTRLVLAFDVEQGVREVDGFGSSSVRSRSSGTVNAMACRSRAIASRTLSRALHFLTCGLRIQSSSGSNPVPVPVPLRLALLDGTAPAAKLLISRVVALGSLPYMAA
jgi:hypothetical protein